MSLSDLTTITNIGPATARALREAGVRDAAHLREIGADAAYRAMVEEGTKPHFIGYYVLHMALQGRPWNDCRGQEKIDLRQRFDALIETCRRPSGPGARDGAEDLPYALSAALDLIGLGARG